MLAWATQAHWCRLVVVLCCRASGFHQFDASGVQHGFQRSSSRLLCLFGSRSLCSSGLSLYASLYSCGFYWSGFNGRGFSCGLSFCRSCGCFYGFSLSFNDFCFGRFGSGFCLYRSNGFFCGRSFWSSFGSGPFPDRAESCVAALLMPVVHALIQARDGRVDLVGLGGDAEELEELEKLVLHVAERTRGKAGRCR